MSDLYTRIVSSLIFPVHERLKRHQSVEKRKELERSQWVSLPELTALRNDKLHTFIQSIYSSVPYYRTLMDSLGIKPEHVKEVADLRQLPLLDKSLIRANSAKLVSSTARHLTSMSTGGSSGEPLRFQVGKARVTHDVAAKWRATRWWGVDIGDREIVVWGSPVELNKQDRVKLIRDAVFRSRLLPAFDMSASSLDAYISAIRDFKPRMLFGYPSSLSYIARHAEKSGIKLDDLGIKVCFVTSESLYPHQSEVISRIFDCPVANGYGGRDAGFIAHACPAGKMHISAEDIIVEIVDEQGAVLEPGHAGEIVVTHLATTDFPFVRYRTGDIGVLDTQPCTCGRALPVLKAIEGRSTDFVVAQDGTVMHGLALIYILRDIDGVEAFKIVQNSKVDIDVQVVLAPYTDVKSVTQEIDSSFKQRMGKGVITTVRCVDQISSEKSGKFRYVESKVPQREMNGA